MAFFKRYLRLWNKQKNYKRQEYVGSNKIHFKGYTSWRYTKICFLITVAWCGFGRWCSLSSIGWFFSSHQFVDATAICWQVGQSVKHLPLTDQSVHKVGVTIKLVLQKQIHGLCYYIKSPTHCIFKKLSKKLLNRQS